MPIKTKTYKPITETKFVRGFLIWLMPFLILMSAFFTEVMKNYNYLETFPRELIFPSLIHVATAALAAVIICRAKRPYNVEGKLISATIFGLLLVDYDQRLTAVSGVFKSIVPILSKSNLDMLIISLIFFSLLAWLSLRVGRKFENLEERKLWLKEANTAAGIFVVVGFIFLTQGVPVLKSFSEIIPQSRYTATAELQESSSYRPVDAATDKPDIYYIVLDRYTNNSVLKKQFGFDNSTFLNSLRGQGFDVKDNAMSAYPYTTASVASVLNMGYHGDDVKDFRSDTAQSATLFHNMVHQGEAIRLLKQHGYRLYNLGSDYGATNAAPHAIKDYSGNRFMTAFGYTKNLRGLETSAIYESPFNRLFNLGSRWPLSFHSIERVDYVRNQMNTLHQLAGAEDQGGRLIFAHILVPHDPYFFNADGSLNPNEGSDNQGKLIKQKYLNQVEFINKQMLKLTAEINKNSSGKAVTILLADEGPYPGDMNKAFDIPGVDVSSMVQTSDMNNWTQADLKMKYGTLQAINIPNGTSDDKAILNPVNTFRVIMNRYLGYGFPYLPSCQFGYPEGRQFQFRLSEIGRQITGTPSPQCKQFE